MSKMYYLVPLWGNCEKYLMKSLQILQNKAARAVTGQSWFTPIRRLLKDCKWLSVNQIIFYQTALQTHKILVAQKPVFFIPRMNTLHPYGPGRLQMAVSDEVKISPENPFTAEG